VRGNHQTIPIVLGLQYSIRSLDTTYGSIWDMERDKTEEF